MSETDGENSQKAPRRLHRARQAGGSLPKDASDRVLAAALAMIDPPYYTKKMLIDALVSVSRAQAYRMIEGTQRWNLAAAGDLFKHQNQREYDFMNEKTRRWAWEPDGWKRLLDEAIRSPQSPAARLDGMRHTGVWMPTSRAWAAMASRLHALYRGGDPLMHCIMGFDPLYFDASVRDEFIKEQWSNWRQRYLNTRGTTELRKVFALRDRLLRTSPPLRHHVYVFEPMLRVCQRAQGPTAMQGNSYIDTLCELVESSRIRLTVVREAAFDHVGDQLRAGFAETPDYIFGSSGAGWIGGWAGREAKMLWAEPQAIANSQMLASVAATMSDPRHALNDPDDRSSTVRLLTQYRGRLQLPTVRPRRGKGGATPT